MTDTIQKAVLMPSPILSDSGDIPCLIDFLVYARTHSGGDVQGIAFATNGTWPVLGFDKDSPTEETTLSVTPIDGRDFDPTKAFELRLWVPVELPDEPAEGDVAAHEFRWVNGVGARELTLRSVSPDSPAGSESGLSTDEAFSPIGYAHRIAYMQHDPRRGPLEEEAKPKAMSAIEYITEEPAYGNMAVTDQLFTGKWN